MSKNLKKRMIQDDSDDEDAKPKFKLSKPSYLNAGEDLLELKKGTRNIEIPTEAMDRNLLRCTPTKKSKNKKSKKDKKEEEKKKKKSKSRDDDVLTLSDEDAEEEEEDDEEEMQRIHEEIRKQQRNRDRIARLKQMNEPDEAAELLAYLEANKCRDDDLDSSAICIEEDDPNKEQTVMVRWRFGCIEKHKMKISQPFEYMYELFAERENVSVNCVSFETIDGTQIYPTDTLKTLKIQVIDVIEGSLLQKTSDKESEEEDKDDGKIDIKFQLKNQKEHICVRIYRHNPLKKAALQVSTKLNIPMEKLKLHFDGDVVDLESTPEDLDVDGGEVFDLQISE